MIRVLRGTVVLLSAVLVLTTVAGPVDATVQGCNTSTTKANNPHYSGEINPLTGHGIDVVAKAQIWCTWSPDVLSAALYLFFCPNGEPSGEESTWTSQGCDITIGGDLFESPPTEEKLVRQVVQRGITGHYSLCAVFNEVEDDDILPEYRRLSGWVYLTFIPPM